jgi:putative membrane protein
LAGEPPPGDPQHLLAWETDHLPKLFHLYGTGTVGPAAYSNDYSLPNVGGVLTQRDLSVATASAGHGKTAIRPRTSRPAAPRSAATPPPRPSRSPASTGSSPPSGKRPPYRMSRFAPQRPEVVALCCRKRAMLKILLRVLVAAAALGVAAWLVPGIVLTGHDTVAKVLTLLIVAVIFGVINAVLKPIIKTVGCAFYLLTLGLVAILVNGLLLWLTSYVVYNKLHEPFHVTGFVAAVEGALIVGVVSWLLHLILGDEKD